MGFVNNAERWPVSRRSFFRTGGVLFGLPGILPGSFPLRGEPTGASCLAFAGTAYPPLLQKLIGKLHPADDDFVSERYAEEIGQVLNQWSQALCGGAASVDFFEETLAEDIAASSLQRPETTPTRLSGPLKIERRSFEPGLIGGRPRFLEHWSSYVASLSSIEVAEFEIYGIHVSRETPLEVETEIRYDLGGTNKQGDREQRVGSWVIAWHKRGDKWFATQWKANPEVRSRLSGPGFTDITGHSFEIDSQGIQQLAKGIDYWRTALDGACGIDVYGNHGVAVGDIDGSGADSFYVCQPSGLPNRLYKNRGDGTFEDITQISGTGILDGTASAIFADFLNRGQQDLLVIRSGGPLLFRNQGDGRFEPQPNAFNFERPPQGTFTSAAVADYNRDGFLDVYLCVYAYYQGLNQYAFPSPYYDAQNGPPNFLFRNRGDGTFEDVTTVSGMDQNNNRYSFAAAWCDYDGNGWPDLYVANDFGRKNLYRNAGDGHFSDVAHEAGVEDYGPGMSVCWFDHNNDGLEDLYVANMWLDEGRRITANERFLPDAPPAIKALYQKHNAGNSLYQNRKGGAFTDRTKDAGSATAGWSWSCAAWDFDHDGFDDLYVANGFVSGPNHYDLQSFFWRQVAQRSLVPAGASSEYEMAWNAVNELLRSDYSWSGYERNVCYANNHDGTFANVSRVVGLDLLDDSRAYALSDFDRDGRLEFILKNRTGPQIRLLRNDIRGIGNSVVFRLRGKTSNRDAIGASLTIEIAGQRQTKSISAGSGFASQHTKELHFGVGKETKPLVISILWPAGTVERLEGIPVNSRVEIEEGAGSFTATPFRSTKQTANAKPLTAESNSTALRTWLISPVSGPDIAAQTAPEGSGILLNFFRMGCGDSERQLEELKRSSAAFSADGLTVVPVSADEKAVGAWNVLYRYLFDRRRIMPIPVSFLLDRSRAILCVYQGFTDARVILQDWKSAPSTSEERLTRALPFSGPYFGNAMLHNYFTDGIAFVEYGYIDEAQAAFQRVVDADPSHGGAWFNLGTIYLGKKMYAEARRCLEQTVKLNPQDADAWNNLGLISGETRDYDRALNEFQQAARANPNHLLAVQNMLGILQFQGRAADAQKELEGLVLKAPGNSGLHLAYGMALFAQGQVDRALTELRTAVRLAPDDPDGLNDLGAVLNRTGRNDEALSWLSRCAEIAPDFDRPVLNIARIYSQMGQIGKARQVLEDFGRRHPENKDIRAALDKLKTS